MRTGSLSGWRLLLLSVTMLVGKTNINAAQVTVAWDPNTEPDIAGYNIYYGTNAFFQSASAGLNTSLTISNLVAGSTYTIYATAFNLASLESDPSDSISYTVPASPGPT
ncbi:MAG TPA: fibronectin type III domain-containing protein, partial [Verrucomicrobiae bacterium]|nr:fibronectin type III domain-containing protein [Verrucomicrobiae bacterium]